MIVANTPTLPRLGRPTSVQAQSRHRELLDKAMELFLERGFDHTTIRDVAAAIVMTRKTVYARYPDKRALFEAALDHAVESLVVPEQALAQIDRSNLEQALVAAARLRIDTTLTPTGLKLQRFLHTESYRFPELMNRIYSRITIPTVDFVTDLLILHNALGNTNSDEPRRAALALMNMVVGVPVRMVLLGMTMTPEDIEDRIAFSVRLFMHGVCSR